MWKHSNLKSFNLGVILAYLFEIMSQKRSFKTAIEEGSSDEVYACKYCSYETNNIDELDEHIIQIHEDSLTVVEEEEKLKKIEEEIDNKKKEVKFEIEEYEKTRKVPKKIKVQEPKADAWYKCGLCLYKTRRKHDLPKHFLTHCTLQTTTVYRCSECNYETKRKNDMPKHMLGHCTEGGMFYLYFSIKYNLSPLIYCIFSTNV